MDTGISKHNWAVIDPFEKQWSEIYYNTPVPKDDISYMEQLRSLPQKPDFENIELFARTDDEDTISTDVDDIIQFCKDLKKSDLDEQTREFIWLDDRTYTAYFPNMMSSSSHGNTRRKISSLDGHVINAHMSSSYEKPATSPIPGGNEAPCARRPSARYSPPSRSYNVPLTAKTLYNALKEKRFDHESLPDADRRLIYMPDPEPPDFFALTETVPRHQHGALRTAIAQHLAFSPLLEVNLSTSDIFIFQLDLHLPFFAMRTDAYHRNHTTTKLRREWIDLSFIAQVLPGSDKDGELGIYPAQVSVTMCGTSARHYTVYGFEDTDFDKDHGPAGDEEDDDDSTYIGVQHDQIIRGKQDANFPIWDPREYFLTTLKSRVRQIRNEWDRLVRTIERAYMSCTCHLLYWYQTMLQRLQILLPVLKATTDLWDNFVAPGGDILYFTTTTSPSCAPRIRNMLAAIRKDFEKLKALYKTLSQIQEQCEKGESSVEAQMMQQNNNNADLMILYICPVSVVSSFFSIDTPIMAFKRNLISFLGSTIVLMLIVQLLRLVKARQAYRPQWWRVIFTRGNQALQGDRNNIMRNIAGIRSVRRTRTV
ncbi:hypothetical protein PtrSN002B_005858 [Pyrenophora tritici-repentis]|nr:hypothetical protein PtrM4_064610 [Pyrenophora tritici-repentis]KAI1549716.1 hypothetical protein PtrSN001A_000680 [Pyrenophora tritici-repentis]KAI1550647.1 hypothetical protein PtrSN002B_005858 [Pyrenophora tritici-repentis]KAI1607294.1 hypothetical protein PtrCC142_000495 [Pyrenophora tritici-repentis]KAI2482912.1 hypothetical protein Ptr902_05229 [Pyrenophora tritici-repentis]